MHVAYYLTLAHKC